MGVYQSRFKNESNFHITHMIYKIRIAIFCAVSIISGATLAQTYPSKPIRVIDGYPPGGGTDIVARTIAPKFLESQGQSWIVDARAGAQGIIGAEIVSKA